MVDSLTKDWIRNASDDKAVQNGCRFDYERGVLVVNFFKEHLKLYEGDKAGQPFIPAPWAEDVLMRIFGWVKYSSFWGREVRRFRKAGVWCPKKNAKALALSTPIPTPTGWTTMGEIQTGDFLFDEQGKQCRVIAATEIMLGNECYEVGFSDGTKIVADAGHQWLTKTLKPEATTAIRTTEQIANTLELYRTATGKAWARNHSIAIAGPIECDPAELPIPPYALGVWLGDGDSDCARITAAESDLEILEHLACCGVVEGSRQQKAGTTNFRIRLTMSDANESCSRGHCKSDHWIPETRRCRECNRRSDRRRRGSIAVALPVKVDRSLNSRLRSMALLGNKHIPRLYLRASAEQRIELLQGLMDTDGSVSFSGPKRVPRCDFATTSEALRDGALELIRSLGMKPSTITQVARCNGKDCGNVYRVSFTAFSDTPVFRLSRKLNRLAARPLKPTRSSTRQIVSATPVKSVAVKCISVDSQSRLYLAGEGMIPTHNSPLGAGVGLYLLTFDGEQGQKVYSAAKDGKQAGIVHKHAQMMVRKSPALSEECVINKTTGQITHTPTASTYSILPGDNIDGQEGLNGSVVIDETHVVDGRLASVLEHMGASRSEPLQAEFSTAGKNPQGYGKHQYDYGTNVENGTFTDEQFFFAAWGAPQDATDDQLEDREMWRKANPSWGITINEEEFAQAFNRAKKSLSDWIDFKMYRFNIWSTSESPWLRIHDWSNCKRDFTADSLAGQNCWLGLDLATTRDMTAMVLVFPQEEGSFKILPFFFMPEDTAKAWNGDVPYLQWNKENHLILTPGRTCEYAFVRQKFFELHAKYKIQEIVYDDHFAEKLTQEMVDGIMVDGQWVQQGSGIPRVEFPQTVSAFANPTAQFEKLVIDGKMHHNGHPVLTWQVGHTNIKTDHNKNKRPVKQKDGDKRTIDGVVAGIMALAKAQIGDGGSDLAGYDGSGGLML